MRNEALRKVAFFVLIIIFGAGLIFAEESKGEKIISTENKEVEGEVMWIGPNYITVQFKVEKEKKASYEMILPIDENITFENKKDLSQIQRGDIVRIKYVEDTLEGENKETGKNTKTKVVTFVKSGVKKIESTVSSSEEGEQDSEGLIFKGLQ